jgi:hypothetical protein
VGELAQQHEMAVDDIYVMIIICAECSATFFLKCLKRALCPIQPTPTQLPGLLRRKTIDDGLLTLNGALLAIIVNRVDDAYLSGI